MAHITLSIPEDLYKLMRKYKEVNWSEIARKAIIEKLLALKAVEEGLTREELVILLELDFLRKIKEREERRIRYLKRLEES